MRECLYSQGTCWVSVELGGGREGGAGVSLLTGNLLGKCGTRRGSGGWGLGDLGEGDGAMGGGSVLPIFEWGYATLFPIRKSMFLYPISDQT